MKTDRFATLKGILVKAVDLSGAERRQYLDEACKDDPELRNDAESILAHDGDPSGILKTGGIIQAPGPGDDLAFTHRRPIDIPQQVARHRVLRKPGEGGMGVVYEAEQRRPRRSVALKVVRGGTYIDERRTKLFQREVQALARLKHPAIAATYESGRTDTGQHFFALELVHGVPPRRVRSHVDPSAHREINQPHQDPHARGADDGPPGAPR